MQYHEVEVSSTIKWRLDALAEDQVLSRKEKEVIICTAVYSAFRNSAGFVDWSKAGTATTPYYP